MSLKSFWLGSLLSLGLALCSATAAFAAPSNISLVVMPHPDDETQAWSLIENSTDIYKVFLYMASGDETVNCEPAAYTKALRTDKGEIAPLYAPTGRWTDTCKTSRMYSTLKFLNAMAIKDASVPAGMSIDKVQTVTVPKNGANPQRIDNGVAISSNQAKVFNSLNGMGKVIFFDLGDADTTTEEVVWAINSVKNNPKLFGIPTNMPFYNAVGPFSNRKYKNCAVYPHADHRAVHVALYSVDFGFTGYQTAATCKSDPEVNRTKKVSNAMWNYAWGVNPTTAMRTGYAQQYYGWLNGGSKGWAVANGDTQVGDYPFMQLQSFWRRF